MMNDRWRNTYDAWKLASPDDLRDPEEGCTCRPERRDRWCPVHGEDPDAARDRRIDDELMGIVWADDDPEPY